MCLIKKNHRQKNFKIFILNDGSITIYKNIGYKKFYQGVVIQKSGTSVFFEQKDVKSKI